VDHRFNDRNLFFGRYDYNKVNTFTPPGLGTNPATGLQISGGQFDFDGPATDAAQQYGFGYTHIFTQNLLVDLRAAFTRINNLSLPLNSTGNRSADAIVLEAWVRLPRTSTANRPTSPRSVFLA
jgi:hypothetical protein